MSTVQRRSVHRKLSALQKTSMVVLGLLLCGLALRAVTATADTLGETTAIPVVKKLAAPVVKTVTKPEWHELTAAQQLALKPLVSTWGIISEGHKRKWLAVSQNFASLPLAEQTRMHGRMTEWAALTPSERSQARLNYAGAREFPVEERLAKWQAYQALTTEQRKQLTASGGPTKPVGAAPAVRPVAPQRLTALPQQRTMTLGEANQGEVRHTPRIAVSPRQIDRNTLLPQPVVVQVQVPSPAATAPQSVPVSDTNTFIAPAPN